MRIPALALSTVLLSASILPAKTITVDGNPSDWTGTPPALIHATVIDQEEWIYRGEAGDLRNDPADPASRPNYDLTEVRLTADATNLYLLVRFADIVATNEVSVAIGIDNDQNPSDSNGLNFLGDDSGVVFANAASHPEYVVHIHNAQDGITWAEFFHDAGGGTWYTNPGDSQTFISAVNNVLEASIKLSAIGLTTSTTFGFSLATFDNGTSLDPGGWGFANATDITVDYPVMDALDAMGGAPGVSEGAFTRAFGSGSNYTPPTIPTLTPATISSVRDWSLID